jgi:hypothetical protein
MVVNKGEATKPRMQWWGEMITRGGRILGVPNQIKYTSDM